MRPLVGSGSLAGFKSDGAVPVSLPHTENRQQNSEMWKDLGIK